MYFELDMIYKKKTVLRQTRHINTYVTLERKWRISAIAAQCLFFYLLRLHAHRDTQARKE